MLSKGTRKKLNRGWTLAIKNEKNQPQFWYRLRRQIDLALDDLILLGKMLPPDKENDVFTPKKFEQLAHALLSRKDPKNIDPRRVKLAEVFARSGLNYCEDYSSVVVKNMTLREPLDVHLQRAQIYCSAISSALENEIKTNKN